VSGELIEFAKGRFAGALIGQLQDDEERWGDTWKKRPREGQEGRIFARFEDYKDQFENGGTPVPWLKIAGLALIALYREWDENWVEPKEEGK
jgi:hypothetical protein